MNKIHVREGHLRLGPAQDEGGSCASDVCVPATAYLGGPMRGLPYWNFPAFDDAQKFLENRGWTIHSPAAHDRSMGLVPVEDGTVDFPVSACLDWDFARIAESSCVIVLPGWEKSTGCHWELTVAHALGKPVFQYPEMTPVELPDVVTDPVGSSKRVGSKAQRARFSAEQADYAKMRGVDGPGAWEQLPGVDPIAAACAALYGADKNGEDGPGAYERVERAVFKVVGFNDGSGVMRTFGTGATRSSDADKLDYEGFLSPYALEEYAKYLHKNRVQADGNVRDSDNWQKGIPKSAYMKSMFRHFLAAWRAHREGGDPTEDLCAVLFNAMGYLHEGHKP